MNEEMKNIKIETLDLKNGRMKKCSIDKSKTLNSRYISELIVGDRPNEANTFKIFYQYNFPSLLNTAMIAWFITFCFAAFVIASNLIIVPFRISFMIINLILNLILKVKSIIL
ncbi:unnamed protein product [Gordionus sp. m RMFG-2023]